MKYLSFIPDDGHYDAQSFDEAKKQIEESVICPETKLYIEDPEACAIYRRVAHVEIEKVADEDDYVYDKEEDKLVHPETGEEWSNYDASEIWKHRIVKDKSILSFEMIEGAKGSCKGCFFASSNGKINCSDVFSDSCGSKHIFKLV